MLFCDIKKMAARQRQVQVFIREAKGDRDGCTIMDTHVWRDLLPFKNK